jgi:hypothetical protein
MGDDSEIIEVESGQVPPGVYLDFGVLRCLNCKRDGQRTVTLGQGIVTGGMVPESLRQELLKRSLTTHIPVCDECSAEEAKEAYHAFSDTEIAHVPVSDGMLDFRANDRGRIESHPNFIHENVEDDGDASS